MTPARNLKVTIGAVLTLLLVVAVIIEALALVELATYPYFPDKSLIFARIDASIFLALAPLSPTLLILLLYQWPIRFGASLNNRFSKRLKSMLIWLGQPIHSLILRSHPDIRSQPIVTNRPRALLLLAVTFAILLGLVPYRPDLNPSVTPLGVDAHFYIDSINRMVQKSPSAAVAYAMGNSWAGSRPLIIIPMYLVVATGLISANQSVEALPSILGALLAVATFVFVREGKDEKLAGVASLFAVFSFSTTVGLWAGYYANWLALAEAYLFLPLLLGFLRTGSKSKLGLASIVSVCILLTHPWTWVAVLGISSLFAIVVWLHDGNRTFAAGVGTIILVTLAADLVKSLVFAAPIAAQDASESVSQAGLFQTQNFWSNIVAGLSTAYGGLFGNAILLGLPVIITIFLRLRNRFESLLMIWIAVSSVPFLFSGTLLQTRILYDLPISTMSAMTVLVLARRAGGSSLRANMIFLIFLLLLANYALRALTNLVAIPF